MTSLVEFCADSFETLKIMGQNDVDVIITDPPYPKEVQDNLCSGSLVGTKSVPKYELPFDPLEDYTWLLDAVRITKRWVVSFCCVEGFGGMQAVAPAEYIRGGIWYKSNAMGQLTRDRPATAYEGIGILHGTKQDGHPKKRWNGRGSYGIWRCNGTRGKKDRHPNEKPIDLCLKFVALFSERGETVFDPFCGSGAIGEACVRLGRNYIGLDNDPEWVEKARARLAMVESKLGLIGVAMTDEEALGLCRMPKVAELAGEDEAA
jgi:site-specific DNA-methyltransferase (adenine-specific)